MDGPTKAKTNILSKTCSKADHALLIQETHILKKKGNRLKIHGLQLINYIGHKKHELVTHSRIVFII